MYEKKEEIEAMAEEVLDMANCFEEDGFHVEVSDVDFSDAYFVFVEADILKEMPKTTEDLDDHTEESVNDTYLGGIKMTLSKIYRVIFEYSYDRCQMCIRLL